MTLFRLFGPRLIDRTGRVLMLMVLIAALPACTDTPEQKQDQSPAAPDGDAGQSPPESTSGSEPPPEPSEMSEPSEPPQDTPGGAVLPTQLAIKFSAKQPSRNQSLAVIQTRIAEQERAAGRGPTPSPPPKPRTIVKGGTIAAPALGLMWLRSAAGVFTFEDAELFCRNQSMAEHNDWRLPSISELEKLVDCGHQPASGPVRMLWSSTSHQPRGWLVYDLEAAAKTHLTAELAHVICVRRLQ